MLGGDHLLCSRSNCTHGRWTSTGQIYQGPNLEKREKKKRRKEQQIKVCSWVITGAWKLFCYVAIACCNIGLLLISCSWWHIWAPTRLGPPLFKQWMRGRSGDSGRKTLGRWRVTQQQGVPSPCVFVSRGLKGVRKYKSPWTMWSCVSCSALDGACRALNVDRLWQPSWIRLSPECNQLKK